MAYDHEKKESKQFQTKEKNVCLCHQRCESDKKTKVRKEQSCQGKCQNRTGNSLDDKCCRAHGGEHV